METKATKLTKLDLTATNSGIELTEEEINGCSTMMQKALCAIALSFGVTEKVYKREYQRKDGTTGYNLVLTNDDCIALLTELGVV